MKNTMNDLINKINELYNIYESYCWKYDNGKINILFQDNSIALYIIFENGDSDELILSFNNMASKTYRYVALKVFDMVLGDVFISRDNNVFYNETNKPYVDIFVNDEKLLILVNRLVFNQEVIHIHEGINKIYNRQPFRIYNTKFFKRLDKKIENSKKFCEVI